jgi:hypothetical protein
MSFLPDLNTLGYLTEVAKDWVTSSFAAAEDSDFVLAPHRFELAGSTVRRLSLPAGSPEATDPWANPVDGAVAWARSEKVTLLVDTGDETVAVEQEIIEILALDGDDVLAEAASVVRITDLPPCLGRFVSEN